MAQHFRFSPFKMRLMKLLLTGLLTGVNETRHKEHSACPAHSNSHEAFVADVLTPQDEFMRPGWILLCRNNWAVITNYCFLHPCTVSCTFAKDAAHQLFWKYMKHMFTRMTLGPAQSATPASLVKLPTSHAPLQTLGQILHVKESRWFLSIKHFERVSLLCLPEKKSY